MPMVPEAVVAMLACARLGAVHSVVFGGFAAHELAVAHRRLPAEAGRLGVVRHRARPDGRVQAAARPRARARRIDRPALRASCSSARRLEADARRPAATSRGTRRWTAREPARLRAGRGDRSALHPLHVRHDRACRRASCATTAATPSRCTGRWTPSTASRPARSTGRRPTSAGWSATPTSSTRRCCTAARRCSTRASRSARPTPAPSGGSAPTTGCDVLFTAPDGDPRDQAGRPGRRARAPATTCRALRTLFLAGERCDPDTLALGRAAARHGR